MSEAPAARRKVTRYAFFILCAFAVGALAYAFLRSGGMNKDVARIAGDVVALGSFFALRDMLKGEAA